MSRNGTGGGKSLEQDLRDHDALPGWAKRLFALQPHRKRCPNPRVVAVLERRHGADAVRSMFVSLIAKDAARDCRKTYGKDHPCVARFTAIAADHAPPAREERP